MSTVELAFRPKSYFGPVSLEKYLARSVHGAERRRIVARYIAQDRLHELPPVLGQKQLDADDRQAFGRIHPSFMGGEYLPDDGEMEVEIARITLRSTLSDVTCVRARPVREGIALRVVDEYEGDTLSGATTRLVPGPLALGELLEFFMGAWDLYEVCAFNYEDDLERALGFFTGSSEFYPGFDAALETYVSTRYRERGAERDRA